MTAIAAARRVGGLTSRPASVIVSSTTVTILRIFAFMLLPLCRLDPQHAFDLPRLPAEMQGRGADQPPLQAYLCCPAAALQRPRFLGFCQGADRDRHQPLTEIVVRRQVARRAPLDRFMAG